MGQMHTMGMDLVNQTYAPHNIQHPDDDTLPEFTDTCQAVAQLV